MQTAAPDLSQYPFVTLTSKRRVQVDENGLIHPRREKLYPPPRPDEVKTALRWLAALPAAARMRTATGVSCYGAKHIMQQLTGNYATNGAFILASAQAGFILSAHSNDLNADSNLSARVLKKMTDAHRSESDH